MSSSQLLGAPAHQGLIWPKKGNKLTHLTLLMCAWEGPYRSGVELKPKPDEYWMARLAVSNGAWAVVAPSSSTGGTRQTFLPSPIQINQAINATTRGDKGKRSEWVLLANGVNDLSEPDLADKRFQSNRYKKTPINNWLVKRRLLPVGGYVEVPLCNIIWKVMEKMH